MSDDNLLDHMCAAWFDGVNDTRWADLGERGQADYREEMARVLAVVREQDALLIAAGGEQMESPSEFADTVAQPLINGYNRRGWEFVRDRTAARDAEWAVLRAARDKTARAEAFADALEIFRGLAGDNVSPEMETVLLMVAKAINRRVTGS